MVDKFMADKMRVREEVDDLDDEDNLGEDSSTDVDPEVLDKVDIAFAIVHGLALNVNTDMEPFGWINPCGLNQVRMTSFEQQLGKPVTMTEARRVMAASLAAALGLDLTGVSEDQLYGMIESLGLGKATN